MTAALVAVSILVGQTPAQPAPAFDVPMPLGLQAPAAAAPLEPPSAPSQAALQSVEVGVDKVDQLPSVLKRSHAPVARPQAVAVQAAASQPRAPTATKSDSAAQSMVARRYPPFADRENAQGLLHLREVVGGSTDTAQRRAAIKLYWEAASLLADWKFARERLQRLSELPPPGDAAAQQDYEAALAAARARLVEAEMAATTARYTLAEVTSGPAGQLPIPADRPFVGPYRTLFDTLFANRPAPPALRRIHATLPLRRQLVDARAAAVAAAAEALEGQMEAYQAGQADVGQVIAHCDRLRHQRGAFLGAVRDYNLEIAQYALAVAQPGDSPERIVAMLIEAPTTAAPAALPGTARATPAAGGTFVAPARIAAPTPEPAAPVSGGAAIPPARPTTSRVLGTLRDVTGQSEPVELEAAPRSSFRAAEQRPADDAPKLPQPTP